MSVSTEAFAFVCDLLRRESAIQLAPGKEYLVSTRLSPIAKSEGANDVDDLVRRVREEPESGLRQRVVEALTTNETLFFRDVHPFDAMKKALIPEIIERNEAVRTIRIWCAACSTGQEPYSISMLLKEHFDKQLTGWNVRILATDLSEAVVEHARAGRYGQLDVGRGLPAPYLAKYFQRDGADWQLKEEIRRAVDFRPMNLITPWPTMGPFDLIMIRNVLIYFDAPTKTDLLRRLADVMRPEGALMLGAAESTLGFDVPLAATHVGRTTVYRRKPGAVS